MVYEPHSMLTRPFAGSDLRSFGPHLASMLAWLVMVAVAGYWIEQPELRYGFFGAAGVGMAGAFVVLRQLLSQDAREARLRATIEHRSEELERERSAHAAELNRQEARLRAWNRELTERAAELGRSAPDPRRWENPAEALPLDAAVKDRVGSTRDRIFEALRDGKYVHGEQFEGQRLAADLFEMVADIAAIYRDGDPEAWLHVDAARMAHAAHRATIRILHRARQFPGAPATRDVFELRRHLQTLQAGQDLYERFKPIAKVAPWAYKLFRVAAGANPIAYTAWSLAFEAVKRGGLELSRLTVERTLRDLLGEMVTIVGDEAALLYGGGYGRREKNHVLATEAVELARQAHQSRAMLAAVVDLLTRIPLRDETERRRLLEALGKPGFEAEAADWLPLELRTEVMQDVERLFEDHPPAMSAKAIASWRTGLEQRLGHRSKLVSAESMHDEGQLESAAHCVLAWAHSRGIALEPVLRALEQAEMPGRPDMAGPAGPTPVLPRLDLSPERQDILLEVLLDVMSRLRPWGPAPDLALLDELARRFRRKDGPKVRQRLQKAYQATVSEMLGRGGPATSGPAAYALLLALDAGERWLHAEPFRGPRFGSEDKAQLREAKQWSEDLAPKEGGMWLLASEQRWVLLAHTSRLEATEPTLLWEGLRSDATLRLNRASGWFASPSIEGGAWLTPKQPPCPTAIPISKAFMAHAEPWLTSAG